MALADRSYMRDENSGRVWSATIVILVINVVVFFIESSGSHRTQRNFQEYGAVSLEGIKSGYIWQLLTYQFMHGGLTHLLFNSIGLFLFGRHMEMMLGRNSFLKLYLLSGVAGGVLQLLLAVFSPRFAGPMVGASAGICGLIAAFALMSPNSIIYLFFFVPVRAKYVLPLSIALSVLMLFSSGQDRIAHGAHLGGLLFGYAFLRWFSMGEAFTSWFSALWSSLSGPRRSRPIVKVRFPHDGSWQSQKKSGSDDLRSGDFITKEVDPILEKISAHGIHSLTDEERKILEAARSRIDKR